MGMAAGQARLLSITARINHNELRAQQITNAKLRLSDSTQEASDEYIKALNDTELKFISYDASGNKTTSALTGNSLSYYGELKNQYGLINAAGQIMVSELDGYNFETSDTLEEFLDKYGLLGPEDQGKIVQVKNPAYDTIMGGYYDEYERWKAQEPDPDDRDKFWNLETSYVQNSELYDKFVSGTDSGCWSSVMNDSSALYHLGDVLSHLLDLGTYTTSDGQHTFEIKEDLSNANPFYHWWTTGGSGGVNGNAATMAEIREQLQGMHCCGKEDTEYHENCDGSETITQKIVDLLWDSQELYQSAGSLGPGDPRYDEILNRAKHLVFYDLKYALNEEVQEWVFDDEKYQEEYEKWLAEEPEKPEVEMYIDKVIRQLTDNDKGQWYINLWHRMNGESDFKSGYMNDENYTEDMGWISDSKTNENYVILEDGLMNSPEWLEFALKNGIITIEQVQFSNPTEEGTGLADVTWTSIEYTSITDISEQSNEVARTKAEVKYNTALKEIEAKDKQYDTDLKNLDTEHNALQTEYDSIKSTIDKNVERSFKAFS